MQPGGRLRNRLELFFQEVFLKFARGSFVLKPFPAGYGPPDSGEQNPQPLWT
jgi:hypothetical protein